MSLSVAEALDCGGTCEEGGRRKRTRILGFGREGGITRQAGGVIVQAALAQLLGSHLSLSEPEPDQKIIQ